MPNPYFTPLITPSASPNGGIAVSTTTSTAHTCEQGTYWIDEVQACLTPDQIRTLLQTAINTFNEPLVASINSQLIAYGLVENPGPQILGIKLVPLGAILAGGVLIFIAVSAWLKQNK